MEFSDFRAYAPGDDLRRVDWNLYRRSRRLFLRLFEAPEDLPVYILLDVSDSMFFEDPPRAHAARQMAGAITGISLNQFDRTRIVPFAEDLMTPLKGLLGRHCLRQALTYLENLGPGGPTDLTRSIRRFGLSKERSGLAVIISDFFDPKGLDAIIQAMKLLRHRLLLVQLVRQSDANPELQGELRLRDCESGMPVDVMVNRPALQKYAAIYRSFETKLHDFAVRRRAPHLKVDADRPVLDQLGSLFPRGTLAI